MGAKLRDKQLGADTGPAQETQSNCQLHSIGGETNCLKLNDLILLGSKSLVYVVLTQILIVLVFLNSGPISAVISK